jgi:excisionase family DNA binding protein
LKRQEKVQQTLEEDKRASVQTNISVSSKSPGSKEYLSVADACELYGISRFTVYRLIDSGKIAAGKIGRRTIIPRSEFTRRAWLQPRFYPRRSAFHEKLLSKKPSTFRTTGGTLSLRGSATM